MAPLTFDYAEPVSSGEIPTSMPERSLDVEHKHRVVAEFLETHQYDALLLQKPSNFAWFTAGADCTRAGFSEPTAALFITPEARVVVTDNVNSAQLFDRHFPGLGFQLKERPWYEPLQLLIDDLCRGRTVASDTPQGQTHDVSMNLTSLRLPLTSLECESLRRLGRQVAHGVEATARHCLPGQSEAEVAGELAHRLIKREIIPARIQVAVDGRTSRYRHWSYGGDTLENSCVISAVGRQNGLHAGAARTVCFGEPPQTLLQAHHRAMLMHATGMYFSQTDWEVYEVWNRLVRIYDKFDCPDEWQLADQGDLLGYAIREVPIVPKSEFRLATRMPIHWHPSVGPAVAGDTILTGEDQFEMLTPMDNWPQLTVMVKGTRIACPDILRRSREQPDPPRRDSSIYKGRDNNDENTTFEASTDFDASVLE